MCILGFKRSRTVRALAAALVLMLVPLVSAAYSVEEVPNVHVRDARQYVSDPDKILSSAARDSIDLMLARLERSTGIESAVVMLPTIGDADIFDFAHELFRTWGIGKKKSNNGFLVLFVMDQRKVRFTTGYGLEGVMTDALSKRIQMQQMVPCFKRGDWDGGMVSGVRAAVGVLDGSMQPDSDGDDDDGALALVALVVFLAFVGGGTALAVYRSSKCPRCGRHGLRKVGERRLRVRMADGHCKDVRRTTYVCRYCGHNVTRDETIDPTSGFVAGSIMGSMGGSSSSGFGGGSFGGGSTGGGGATSGW